MRVFLALTVAACGGGGSSPDATPPPPDAPACMARYTIEAPPTPGAFEVVLDGSASMGANGRWPVAQSAIAAALAKGSFDGVSVGLRVFPEALTAGPACLCDTLPPGTCPMVACGEAGAAAVPPSATGAAEAATWLPGHQPLSG